jgi:hypothetical protein
MWALGPLLQIRVPARVVRVHGGPDLDISHDGRCRGVVQVHAVHLTSLPGRRPEEHPLPAVSAGEVLLPDPASSFGGMSPACPAPEQLKERMVYLAEDPLADHVPVIGRPAPDLGVQQPDQMVRSGLAMALHGFPHVGQERGDDLARRARNSTDFYQTR